MSTILFVLLNTNCKPPVVVPPTLNVNPILFVILVNTNWALYIHNVAIIVTYGVNFHPNVNHP